MEYKTSDIYLATTLVTMGFPVLRLDRSNEKRQEFCFEESMQLLQTVDLFWEDGLKVTPQKLLTNLKSLKNRIYNS